MTRQPPILLIVAVLLLAGGCDQPPETQGGPIYGEENQSTRSVLRLAIHPLHNPRKLTQAYQPLIAYLNRHIPESRFALEASRDYQAYEAKFRDRKPELLLPNPWQTLEAIKVGYNVIAMAGDAEDFKGIFLVRKDSGIKHPSDLLGKIVSYPSHTALAACIMPQRFLHDSGIDIRKDITNRYVGSQESSIMNALLGESAAGATWPPPWRLFQKDRPQDAAQLQVIWETPHLMNNSVMARDDVPAPLVRRIRQLLTELHETQAGSEILPGMETARFYPADNNSYDPVRLFVDRFEREIRPVEQP
jgi:phosphonate transport system substrate-binding protein